MGKNVTVYDKVLQRERPIPEKAYAHIQGEKAIINGKESLRYTLKAESAKPDAGSEGKVERVAAPAPRARAAEKDQPKSDPATRAKASASKKAPAKSTTKKSASNK